MREPPRLAEATIDAALRVHYGLDLASLTFLPLGNDADSAVYRAEAADGAAYFVKLRAAGGFSLPSLAVPHFLHRQGVPHILAPIAAANAQLWVDLGGFALSLYPFLNAQTAASAGLSEPQWRALGATLRQIHASRLPPALAQIVRRETFVPSRRAVLGQLAEAIAAQALAGPAAQRLAAFWQAHEAEISTLIERADALDAQLRRAGLSLALCHADLHTWNVLVDDTRQLWVVDWDEVLLAPKERDLMFCIGGIADGLVRPHETASFLAGYGAAEVHQAALTYYRYAWAMQDMAAYAEQACFAPDVSAAAREQAADGFIGLFAPGAIVAIARRSEER